MYNLPTFWLDAIVILRVKVKWGAKMLVFYRSGCCACAPVQPGAEVGALAPTWLVPALLAPPPNFYMDPRIPANTRLNHDGGYVLPGCWITIMKKLGGGANRAGTYHVGASASTSAPGHTGAASTPIKHQHFCTSLHWGWLEHLVETSASCTQNIKLSTKNLRCFYITY